MAEQDRLTDVDWEHVWKRVELYAFRITGQPYVSDHSDQVEYVIGQGVGGKDLASQVLYDFLTGGIPPDPSKNLTETYLVKFAEVRRKKTFRGLA